MTSLSAFLLVIVLQGVLVTGSTWNSSEDGNQPSPFNNSVCLGHEGTLVCSDCSNLGVCLDSKTFIAVHDCSFYGQVCSQGACVDEAEECSGGLNITCLAEGSFPDPRDCSRSVVCAGAYAEAEERSCPRGARYNACTQHCDVAGTAPCAWDTPGEVCARPGLLGVAPENDRLFYICGLAPDGSVDLRWSRCELGHFDPVTLQCVDKDVGGCRASSDGGSTTTTELTTGSWPSSPPSTEGCVAGESYERPETNCSFLFCKPDHTYLVIQCSKGFHFDAEKKACVLGECTDYDP